MTCTALEAAGHFTVGAVAALLGIIGCLAFAYVWFVKGRWPWG